VADVPGTRKPATRTSRSSPQPRPMSGRLPAVARQARQPKKQHMSNAQPDTRGAGGERRKRRSRGGRGRNRTRQDEQGSNSSPQSRGERGERGERRERTHGGQHRGERNQNRGERGDRDERGPRPPRKEFKPAPLKWWQKLLKAIGLYKEPVRPPRPERKESVRFEEGPPSGDVIPTAAPREVKSNTRNARQPGAEGGAPPRERERERDRDRDRDRDRERRPERSERSERTEVSGSRIYLGNLSYDTTEEDLKDLFKGVGTVRNVEIVYNRRTHKSKGYGFVDMLNTEEAKRCVEVLHDQFFMGRKLVVSGAKSKEHEDALREEIVEREPRAAAAAVATAAVVAPVAVEEATPVAEAAPVEEVTSLVEAAPVEEAQASEPVAEAEVAPAPVAENEEQTPDTHA
jgi:hypothetical protein